MSRLMRKFIFYFFLLQDIISSRLNLLKAPFKYIIVVTKKCNSKCKNCLIWTEKIQNELTLDEYEQIAIKSPQLKWLNLTGGEVTLRDDLVQIVHTFKTHCKKLEILNFTTNGIDPENIFSVVQQLHALDFLVFTINISLDGDQKKHNHLRGIQNNFSNALKTYEKIKTIKGIKTHLSFTIYDSNVSSFENMFKEAKLIIPDLQKKDFHLNLENLSSHYYGNDKIKKNPAANNLISQKINLLKQYSAFPFSVKPTAYFKWMYHKLAIKYMQSAKQPIKCMSMTNSVYISELGEIYPCVIWNKKISSLRNDNYDIQKSLANASADDAKKKILNKNCPNCWTPCEAYQSMLSSPLGF